MATKEYIVKAQGVIWVSTKVRARSRAEALRLAKEVPEHEWKSPEDNPHDFAGHYIADEGPAKPVAPRSIAPSI